MRKCCVFLFFYTVLPPLSYAEITSSQSNSSIVVCEGGTAELVCPRGTVISIALANYGRYSARVCYENEELDVVVPMTQCHNPKTVLALQKSCSGRRQCRFVVNNDFFVHDPCPGIKKYLDVTYACVTEVTTTTTTTAAATTTTALTSSWTTFAEVHDDVKRATSAKSTPIICAATSRRGIEWPVTVAETTVNRSCPEGTRGTSSWRCTSEGFWSESEPNTMGCQSDWTTQRHDALEETIKDQDSSGIPELLRAMTSDTRRPMVAGDLPKLLDILDIIQDIIDREAWAKNSQKLVNQLIVNVVHNTLRAKEIWQNWPLIKRQVFATRLLACVERAMTSASVTIHSSENYVQPLVMTEMSESIRTSAQQSGYFLFPSMALWAGENNVDSVDIPKEALEITGMDRSRVYYASLANIGEQMEPPVQKLPATEQLPAGGERRRRVISRVVAASIVLDGKSIRLPVLPKPVIITFHHHPEALRRMMSPECSWWDAEDFKWSSSGCSLQSHNSTHTICTCNHMTHYAVLMDLVGHEISTTDNRLLTILTYCGCGLSIICLAITFLCFVVFVRGGGDRCFECSVIAGCLLYFFLSALTWMLLEGYQLYQMLVEMRHDMSRWCARHPAFSCFVAKSRSASKDHHNENREAISPSDKSGTGSESIYPASEKLHTSPRGLNSPLNSGYFQQPLIHHYQSHPQANGMYDYATIAYGEMVPGHLIPRKLAYPHPNVAVHCPPHDQSLIRSCGGDVDSVYQPQVFRYNYHRPPPDFSPPPPPDRLSQQAARQLFASARPPSSKLSDDSAYSDGGSSSVLTTEVTPSGTTVLRMELGRNQPNHCRNV
ncbi:hypothetical protein Angca_009612 [Angiostrongylus cantonensis]|nr:hypothetical protein Angca_009612 [Angiostrongylus cantonensis]